MGVYQSPSNTQENETDPNPYREVVLGWERKRLRFNLILLPIGILALLAWSYHDISQLAFLIPGSLIFAIGANGCYLLGPLVECYCRAFFENSRMRSFLYWAGLIFSALVILGFGILGLGISSFHS